MDTEFMLVKAGDRQRGGEGEEEETRGSVRVSDVFLKIQGSDAAGVLSALGKTSNDRKEKIAS